MKIDIFQITEAEMEIMDTIWQAEKPITLTALGKALAHKNRKHATLHTLAGRLVKKGLAIDIQVSGQNLYLPLFSKEDYLFVVAKNLLRMFFHGSFPELAATLLKDMDLTREDLTILKTMVASATLPSDEWSDIMMACSNQQEDRPEELETQELETPESETPKPDEDEVRRGSEGIASFLAKNTRSVRFNRIQKFLLPQKPRYARRVSSRFDQRYLLSQKPRYALRVSSRFDQKFLLSQKPRCTHRVSSRFEFKKENRVYGKDNGKGCSLGQKPGFYLSWFRDLRRPCEHLGLWAAGS